MKPCFSWRPISTDLGDNSSAVALYTKSVLSMTFIHAFHTCTHHATQERHKSFYEIHKRLFCGNIVNWHNVVEISKEAYVT